MKTKYSVILNADERSRLVELTKAGSANVRSLKRAQMLLKADESPAGEGGRTSALARHWTCIR